MAFDMHAYRAMTRLEEKLSQQGMRLGASRWDSSSFALFPVGDSLPSFSRDEEVFSGNSDEIIGFLSGIEWATRYYQMLGLVSNDVISKKEQAVRNRQLMQTLKDGNSKNSK